jgi:hypothetical protein
MARRLLMGIWLEALLSCRYDGTCLNIVFHEINRSEENHDGCG